MLAKLSGHESGDHASRGHHRTHTNLAYARAAGWQDSLLQWRPTSYDLINQIEASMLRPTVPWADPCIRSHQAELTPRAHVLADTVR